MLYTNKTASLFIKHVFHILRAWVLAYFRPKTTAGLFLLFYIKTKIKTSLTAYWATQRSLINCFFRLPITRSLIRILSVKEVSVFDTQRTRGNNHNNTNNNYDCNRVQIKLEYLSKPYFVIDSTMLVILNIFILLCQKHLQLCSQYYKETASSRF